MTVYAITDTKKGRTAIAPTYLHTTRNVSVWPSHAGNCVKTNEPRIFRWRKRVTAKGTGPQGRTGPESMRT